ncbi:hypothetical protein FRC12_014694, partial [Ceratobasidium sp. 428]
MPPRKAPAKQAASASKDSNKPDDASASKRLKSGRVSQPSRRIVEQQEQEKEADEIREAQKQASATRAAKRPHDYSLEDLEELVDERAGVNDTELQPPPRKQPKHTGVNLNFVNQVRQTAVDGERERNSPARTLLPQKSLRVADGSRPGLPILSEYQHKTPEHLRTTPATGHPSAPPQGSGSRPSPGRPTFTPAASTLVSSPRLPPAATVRTPAPRSYTPAPSTLISDSDTYSNNRSATYRQSVVPANSTISANAGPSQGDDSIELARPGLYRFVDDPDELSENYSNFGHAQPPSNDQSHPFLDGNDVPVYNTFNLVPPPAFGLGTPLRAAVESASHSTSPVSTGPYANIDPRSIALTPPIDSALSTDRNNDPDSPSYGDGDGELLPPRHVSAPKPTLSADERKKLTKEERKRLQNAKRPKSGDLRDTETEILQKATSRLISLTAFKNPLPDSSSERVLMEESWRWARESLKKRIACDKHIMAVLKRNLGNHRTCLLAETDNAVMHHFKFKEVADEEDGATRLYNKELAEKLLHRDGFAFGNVETRENPFQNRIISFLVRQFWFRGKRSVGAEHPDTCFPITVTPLAFTMTLAEKSIKEWKSGTKKKIPFTADDHRTRFSHFRSEIIKFRDNKLVKTHGIYERFVTEIELAARNATRHGLDGEPDDAAVFEGDSAVGLDDNEIERAIQQQIKKSTSSGLMATAGSSSANQAADQLHNPHIYST